VLCGPYGHIAEPEGAPDFSPEMQILREVVAVGVTSAPLSFPRDFSMVVEKATNLLKKMVEEARLAGTHS
jgi:hypothetical protein